MFRLSAPIFSQLLQIFIAFTGFGRFLVGIYSFLILQNVTKVATVLDFKPSCIDQIERSSNPQLKFFQFMREKGIISPSDISKFLDALEACDLGGIATDVNEKFEQYLHEEVGKLDFKVNLNFYYLFVAKKEILVSELKATYRDLYDAVQPIPYIRDRLYCVDKIFVEGGIQFLAEKGNLEGHDVWQTLPSYHSILNDPRVKSERVIIEGEPGYGKSTITLQMAYDWCQKVNDPYLKHLDVLILLRLRQLGEVASIYRAIKQFLLPIESELSEKDIKDILLNCAPVMIVLDGYDEYPDSDKNTNFTQIIARKMFQKMKVVLTTRSSYLPSKYPALTKRLKLSGFGDSAREKYIQKAVVRGDINAADKIKQQLKQNPIIGDLCQVPLIFVMFAHMCHESKHFQKFTSVTSFFRYMISCFHSHMKNKMEDTNVKKYDLLEKEHSALDKLAFEGLLCGKIVWEKEDLCQRLGNDFYDQYVRIGILVEDEVLDFSEYIEYKTEVRFYHKLFCEWYAAYHLSEYALRNELTLESQGPNCYDLVNLSPSNVQYTYRFACGLNHRAGEKLIGYLKTREDADKCVILCVLELGGKEAQTVLLKTRDLCSQEVKIRADDSHLFQRSIMMFLEVATTNKVG
ncbi:NLR family CARD domain-containing protein 4 [Holothuria leucospilota]|uniref:NLR family CARD domain-containing protein 4 n=1 Tax=Holothuria leucospilota TaxID=206669 RepID=A0A9Q1CLA7_HOLLE|nr:NLR family CARD domain-containing protein 4 [Holothuria leucospilota]